MTRLERYSAKVFKNKKTTTFALICYGTLAALGWYGIFTWPVLGGYFTGATAFLFAEDGDDRPVRKPPEEFN